MKQLLSEKDRSVVAAMVPFGGELASTSVTARMPSSVWDMPTPHYWASSTTTESFYEAAGGPGFEMSVFLFGAPLRPIRVLVRGTLQNAPDWLGPAEAGLQKFRLLRPGWDSYNAPAVDSIQIGAARELLQVLASENVPAPSLTLTSGGQIQVEWHTTSKDLEIRVLSPGHFSVLYEDAATGSSWEGNVSDIAALQPLLPILRTL